MTAACAVSYPGPQSGSVGSRSWATAHGDRQALAELGFIVVSIDGRGTPGRSKSFHDCAHSSPPPAFFPTRVLAADPVRLLGC